MANQPNTPAYDYVMAGFNGFLQRSLDSMPGNTLRQTASNFRKMNNQQLNLDHRQTTGSLGSVIQVGTGVQIDGTNRRISIYDENNNEVVRLGAL